MVLREIQIILLGDGPGQKTAADEMAAAIPLHARLWCGQADERLRHKSRSGLVLLLGRTILDVPRAGSVHTQHGHGGLLHLPDDGREGVAEGPAEGEAKDGVDHEIGRSQGGGKVGHEGDVEVFQLGFQALSTIFRSASKENILREGTRKLNLV